MKPLSLSTASRQLSRRSTRCTRWPGDTPTSPTASPWPAREAPPGCRLRPVPDWLAEELPDLSTWHVLGAGPPAFVDACVAKVQALGAAPERILPDSFTPTVG